MGQHIHHFTGAACAALMLATGSTVARAERGPECNWSHEAQRFARKGAPAWVSGGGAPGFAATYIVDDDRHWLLLHHCASAKYILIVARDADFDRVSKRFDHLLETDKKYTMDQIGTELAVLGAGVRRGQGDIGRCDCDFLASLGPLE